MTQSGYPFARPGFKIAGVFLFLALFTCAIFFFSETGMAAAPPNSVSESPPMDAPSAYPPPEITVANITVTEGDSGIIQAIFEIIRSGYLGYVSTIDYATSDGSATAPGDYGSTSGTLVFDEDVESLTVVVDVKGDTIAEADEEFYLDLSNPVLADLIDNEAQCLIIDNDPRPEISIADMSITEGNSGAQAAKFTVSLDAAAELVVTVNYATSDGTATDPADYLSDFGSITFEPGETTKEISVDVVGDVLDEFDETFQVDLSDPVNATLDDGQASGTIVDDDLPPGISIADQTINEGDSGTTAASFTVTLDSPSGKTVSVNYATADDSAKQPADYLPASGTLTFLPGDTSESFTVQVVGDTIDENNESFWVNLSTPINGTIVDGQAKGTITDDDQPPAIRIADVSINEGDSGAQAAKFTVSLDAASELVATVDFATSNFTATQPADYLPASGSLTFQPGETTKEISVDVVGDVLDEFDETFQVKLSNPVNATLADGQAIGTIIDDDPLPTLTISDVTVIDGYTSNVMATFVVTLNAASGKTVTVNFSTQDNTANAPSDYTAKSGTLTFLPGQTSISVDVTVIGSLAQEEIESFFLNLSGASNATLGDNQGIATILKYIVSLPIIYMDNPPS